MRDPDTGSSKGFGFISYDNFDSSDAAIAAMNGTVSFIFFNSTPSHRVCLF
jgi:RNA recognition motif-containing protein